MRDVASELAGFQGEPVRLPPNLASHYRRQVGRLHTLLEDNATRTEAVEIIRSLIDQVTFRPASDVGLEIELIGDIAGMVRLAQNPTQNSPVHDEFARSVKVVAGARNQRYLPMFAGWIPRVCNLQYVTR